MHNPVTNHITDLQDIQIEILNCIIDFSKENKYPPTIRELCTLVGFKSPSSVHHHLNKLEECGYIKKDPTKPRTLTVTNKYFLGHRVYKPSYDKKDIDLLFKNFKEIINCFEI